MISTHAPHTRSDNDAFKEGFIWHIFQPTPLIRGATGVVGHHHDGADISTHAPHTRSDLAARPRDDVPLISTHAPHTRSDSGIGRLPMQRAISTHAPHTRSDLFPCASRCANSSISTHAPHTRSDSSHTAGWDILTNFNPRPSYEERLISDLLSAQVAQFQPTPLIRGATGQDAPAIRDTEFQPTPLIRGATATCCSIANHLTISCRHTACTMQSVLLEQPLLPPHMVRTP